MDESRSIPTATSFRTAHRRRARRPPQGAQGGRQEALLHAPDRLGDRQGRRRDAGDGQRLRRAGRQAACGSSRARSASASRSTSSARTARARSSCPVVHGAGALDFADFVAALRRAGRRRARQHAAARRLRRREHHAHQPRRHRHRRLGAAADARPGHDRRHRRDRLPARPRSTPTPSSCASSACRRS